ncbi:hypothetical protein [Chamaesiphon sp.]|uniref:hypothetical protein n=1 Tax=Chamaesiphon sp. TaxID=2814140 RepID=UPI003593DC86
MKKIASRCLTGLLLSSTVMALITNTARAQGNLPPKVSAANNYISLLANEDGLVPSYDPPQYQTVGNNYQWTGGDTRTIYNPLDGGIFLQYKPTSFGNSDGCSGGLPEHKKKFFEACFAHDHNWDAPLRQMGFPQYRWNSIKTRKLEVTDSGKDLADYLFLKDMLRLGTGSIDKTAAESFYTAVLYDNGYRDDRGNAVISQRGGAIVVRNKGAYVMRLKVSWRSPQGARKEIEVKRTGTTFDRPVAIPLSVGATDIVVECRAVAGRQIFKQSLRADKVHTFTVSGTTLFPKYTTSLN